MASEQVGVVIVTYNSAAVLPGLLRSLPDGLDKVRWRLVVVDSGSSDESLDIARKSSLDAMCVNLKRNAGYAAGINAGIAAMPEVTSVLILNADVRLSPGCVRELVRGLRQPGTGIAVPHLRDGRGMLNQSMRREPSIGREFLETVVGAHMLGRIWDVGILVADPEKYTVEQTTDWAEGSTQLISRECLDACGPWDESFFLFSEETDFGLRARDAGFATRYIPTASATHLEGGSVDDPAKWALLCRNKIHLYRRRNGPIRWRLFYLCVLARESSRALTGRKTSAAAIQVLLRPSRLNSPAGPNWLSPTADTH